MGRKGESIFKRSDGRLEGRYIKDYDKNGKAIYGSVYAHTYNECKRKKLKLLLTNILPRKNKKLINQLKH